MPGLDPGIHVLLFRSPKTWMAGSSPAMTAFCVLIDPADQILDLLGVRA
jgi:hypothetical protein